MRDNSRRFMVTGGAGFIGSAVIRHLLKNTDDYILNVDALTYAGNLASLDCVKENPRYKFSSINICNREAIEKLFIDFQPDIVMHLAAESHVDRSIDGPAEFIQTNIVGTYTLLEASKKYWSELTIEKKQQFRFHHVSTDEVYGDLEGTQDLFTEKTPYNPSSPYSASKASSDHLVRAWYNTYNLPVLITNCSNNFGPFQFPEKLIPLMISNCIDEKPLPVYGTGFNIRDWIHVDDHCNAIYEVVKSGKIGETYLIGADNELKNIDIVKKICTIMDELAPRSNEKSYLDLISYVEDRPGHDARYAINFQKISEKLNWRPRENFDDSLKKTIIWYLNNEGWWRKIQKNNYHQERLGKL